MASANNQPFNTSGCPLDGTTSQWLPFDEHSPQNEFSFGTTIDTPEAFEEITMSQRSQRIQGGSIPSADGTIFHGLDGAPTESINYDPDPDLLLDDIDLDAFPANESSDEMLHWNNNSEHPPAGMPNVHLQAPAVAPQHAQPQQSAPPAYSNSAASLPQAERSSDQQLAPSVRRGTFMRRNSVFSNEQLNVVRDMIENDAHTKPSVVHGRLKELFSGISVTRKQVNGIVKHIRFLKKRADREAEHGNA